MLPLYSCPQEKQLSQDEVCALQKAFAEIGHRYEIDCDEYQQMPYPYNILMAFDRVTRELEHERPYSDFYIVRTDENKVALLERETVPNNNTLYYIPVAPLYHNLKEKPKCRGLQMLLSVFAYLYHVVGVPYYSDSSSFLNWQYEMIAEWTEHDYDSFEEGFYQKRKAELRKATHLGEQIGKKIHNPCHLDRLGERVTQFAPKCSWDEQVHHIGRQAFNLYSEFPQATLISNVTDNEYDYYEETVGIDQYVSFIHDIEGSLYDDIFQAVNDDLCNRGSLQEPTIDTLYGIEGKKEGSLEFERRLFTLIDDLITLLMAM